MITSVTGVARDPLGRLCALLKVRITCIESYENDVVAGISAVITTDAEGMYSFELFPGKYHIETQQINLFEWIDNGIVDLGEGVEYNLSLPELINDYKWVESDPSDEENPVLTQ